MDYYEILGLSQSASPQQIKEAYRSLVRVHHPDANPHNRESSEALMKDVLRAYATLIDPEKRAIYDRDARIRGYDSIQPDNSPVNVVHHPTTYRPTERQIQSLMTQVRTTLGDNKETFAGKLGLSEEVLAEFEARDVVPQSPLQLRTFTNLVDIAARKLEMDGKGSEATDIRTALLRKKARNYFR
jgi:curved DNA-binding protein CbpA